MRLLGGCRLVGSARPFRLQQLMALCPVYSCHGCGHGSCTTAPQAFRAGAGVKRSFLSRRAHPGAGQPALARAPCPC